MDKENKIYKAFEIFISICITSIIIATFILVLTRYIFHISWPWLNTVIKLSASWLVFIGAFVGLVDNDHFVIDILSNNLSDNQIRFQKIVISFIIAISLLFLVIAGWQSLDIGMAKKDPATGMSMIYIYISVFVGALLMLIYELYLIINLIIRGDTNGTSNYINNND